jgi:glycosyltransferase involved in cell wall biosynthesis
MKGILFLIGTYPSYGGTEQVTTYLANEFVKNGHDVAIASFEQPNPELQKDCRQEINLVRLSYPVLSKNNIIELNKVATEMDIDIIINQWALPFQTNRLCRKIKNNNNKCKIVSVYHNAPNKNARVTDVDIALTENANLSFFKRKKLKLKRILVESVIRASMHYVYQNSDQYVILSDSYKNIFCDYAKIKNTNKLSVITNPLTISDVAFDLNLKEKVFLYVGRIDYNQKRVERIIDAWEQVSPILSNWRLEIVGDGSEKKKLETKVAQRQILRVSFEGFQDPLDYYKKASILLLTSEYEGFGLVVVEGMRYGVVPLVYGSYEAVYDIIDNNSNGIITKSPYKQTELINAMLSLAKNDELLTLMRVKSIESSNKFTIVEVSKKWEKLFNILINK